MGSLEQDTMLIIKPGDIKPSEITDQKLFLRRRAFFNTALHTLAAAATVSALPGFLAPAAAQASVKFKDVMRTSFSTDEPPTGFDEITAYNNFYEFGTDKEDPARNAVRFRTRPWSLTVEGEVARPGVYDLEDFIKPHRLEERIYRLRCVEAWSMVIPWVGIPLAEVIKTAGFAAFVLLIPLAATSTNAMIRRLGGSRWKRLHSTVYLIATLAVLHFLWLVKADIREPFIYGILLTALLAFRIPPHGCRVPAKDRPTAAELTPATFL